MKKFWEGEGGGREVLAVAYPLILAQMSFTVQVFVDRLFLTWYSAEAVAGAVTGLFAVWALIGLCIGTGEYLTTFVAQYAGAGRPERIGPAMWQGIYFSLAAGTVLALLAPLAGPAFSLAGHEARVRAHEVTFASILLLGAGPVILMATLSTFFAGRGNTRVILVVNVIATAVNCLLDYAWIFGHLGFSASGVAGAAWATVTSQVVGSALFLALILRREHRRVYRTLAGWRLEPALFARFLRFGLPTGLQYSVGDRVLRPLHDPGRAHRHARARGQRDRLQPQHDRLHAHAGPRGGRLFGGGPAPRRRPARGRGAHRLGRPSG